MSVPCIPAAVAVAALSVIGLMAVARACVDALWSPHRVTVAVVWPASEGVPMPEVLDLYLGEAVRSPARRRGTRPLVLVASSLLSPEGRLGEEAMTVIDRYGAVLIAVADDDLKMQKG